MMARYPIGTFDQWELPDTRRFGSTPIGFVSVIFPIGTGLVLDLRLCGAVGSGMAKRAWGAAVALTLAACGSSSENSQTAPSDRAGNVALSGAVHKGPFVLGSTVNISAIDDDGTPGGQQFSTSTTSDAGDFAVSFDYRGRIALEATGYYYNEATGLLANGSLTLRAFADIARDGEQRAYINIITHLSSERVKRLLASGTDLSAAVVQAEGELRTALGLVATPDKSGIEMNLLGGDDLGNAYSYAVSTLFAQAAFSKAGVDGPVDANLQEAINAFALDLSDDGAVAASRTAPLTTAQGTLRPFWVEALLSRRLAEIGSAASVPNLDRVIDSDADGVVNDDDNCPLTANPAQDELERSLCDYSLSFEPLLGPSEAEGGQGSLLSADFSGEGITDVLYVTPSDGAWLLEGLAAGGFAPKRQVSIGPIGGHALAAVDINADGRADVVEYSGNDGPPWLAHVQNEGTAFGAGTNMWPSAGLPDHLEQCLLVPNEPWRVWGDLDGDQQADVLFHAGDSCVVAMFVDPDGALNRPRLVADRNSVSGLPNFRGVTLGVPAIADMNLDGYVDVVLGENDHFSIPPDRHDVSVYLGDASGSFTQAVPFEVPQEILQAAPVVVDIDQDGDPDALVRVRADDGGTTLVAFRGDGGGGFVEALPVKHSLTDLGTVGVADLNGDGVTDLAGPALGILFGSSGGFVDGGSLAFDVPGVTYDARLPIQRGQRQCLLGDYLWKTTLGRREAGLVTLCL
jgi:hypothetical protein